MKLTDEENSAESGIDVVASPPGKRLQSVLLLSGGEKALTALALLVGIFQYAPSPFCILDEVDAPLDEANIGRFTELVKEMSVQTQFVLITHSKKTMSIAPVLYGVTMQEPGVSKLVSVRFGSSVLTLRLDPKLKKQLDVLSQAVNRSRSFVAAEAIREYVELNNWQIAETVKALSEADRGDFATDKEMEQTFKKWTRRAR
jgi:predicted transcriptional regulator